MSAAATERLRAWTYRRQRLGRAAADPAEALRDVVGVYSSHPSAPLTLAARSTLDADSFRRLAALRLPAMRGSVFLLPAETAHLAFRAVREPGSRRAYVLKYFGLSAADYEKRKAKVLKAAMKEPLTAKELRAITGVQKESMLVSLMCRDGVLRRIGADGLRSNQLRYVAADIPEADPEEALAWLAGEYLRAFGPARVEDFTWWSGAPPKAATAALATVETAELDGGYLLRFSDADAFASVEPVPKDVVDILPKWDAYTMGYPADGRARLVDPRHQERLYDFRGDGLGAVLVGGRAVGSWTSRFKGRRMEVEVDLFAKRQPTRLRKAIKEGFERIAGLLDASEVRLT